MIVLDVAVVVTVAAVGTKLADVDMKKVIKMAVGNPEALRIATYWIGF